MTENKARSTVGDSSPSSRLSDGPSAGRVTVAVVSHNSARHLPALAHAFEASSSVPDTMLVVDNASVDDSVTRARLAGFDVYETGSNDGFGAACNVALRMANTQFVLICNPDVLPSPKALELLLHALDATPTAAIAGAAFERPFHARRFSRVTGNLWSFLPGTLQRPLKHFAVETSVDPAKNHVVVDYVVGAFMLCRVAAVLEVGGFDEDFFLYSEEEDLCRRLKMHGWQTLFVPSVTLLHEHSTSSEGVDVSSMAPFRFHSLYWYYRKYHSRCYAEFARCALAACIVIDRTYRALTRQRQVYGPGAAPAAFRKIDSVRRLHERYMNRRRPRT